MHSPALTTIFLLSLHQFVTSTLIISTSDRIILTKNSLFRPLVTKTYDQLIYASFPKVDPTRRDYVIRLESEKMGYRPCDLVITDTRSKIIDTHGLDSMANGKLVLGLITDDRDLIVVVVDPDSCDYDCVTIDLFNSNSNNNNNNNNENPASIVVGDDAFDVFLTGHANCSSGRACRLRYDQRARLVGTTDINELGLMERVRDAVSWSVSSIGEKDFTDGYLFTIFTDTNGTLVRQFDQDLQLKNEKHLGKTFLHSVLNGRVSSCRGVNVNELECQLLDDDLQQLLSNVKLDAQPYRRYLRAARLVTLTSGALLYLVLQLDDENEFVGHLQRIDQFGRVGRAMPFQDDLCKDLGKLRLTVSRMHDDLYCLSLSCRSSIRTKCVAFVD